MSYKKITLLLFLGVFLSAEKDGNAQAISDTFKVTGSGQSGTIQQFTVPTCVTAITVTAYGAQGGANGGLGAEIQGTFAYSAGTVLNILVGQPGGSNDNSHGSGGGGSFVTLVGNDSILVVAGGGGGHGASGIDATSNGSAGRAGQSGVGSGTPSSGGGGGAAASGATGGVGCNNGSPAGGSTWAGGGGGFCGNGGTYNSGASEGGYSYISGGLGGTPATGANAYGGFGGGSGAGDRGGGGGGYSGGAGGTNGTVGGGGGGSYNAGINQVNLSGIQSGNGLVIISYVADSIGSNSATGNVISNIVCNGSATGAASIFINNQPGTSGITYLWNPNVSSSDTASNLQARTYTVTISGCAGGTSSTTVTITQPGFFAPNPTINYPLCNGATGSIIGNAIGGTTPYTYAFTPGGNVPAVYGLTAGTYSLNILDNRGCATSKLIALTQPTAIAASASLLTAPNCYGGNQGTAVATVTGGTYPYGYAWSPAGGNNVTASNLSAGNYMVTITDANGCTETTSVTITQPAYLGVIVTPPLLNLACNGDNNGVLGSGISGGVRPYTYFWSGGLGTDTDVMNLSAGTYFLTVSDAHGCVNLDSAIVVQPPALNVTMQTTLDDGHCTGSAWVVLSGGTPSYNYLWSNGSQSFYQDSLCAGESYCCMITDANNCKYNICSDIESSLGVGSISGTNDKVKVYPNPNNGQFTVELSSGNGNMTLEVYNVLGEKVYTQMSNGNSEMTINMSAKANGVYLYRVISNDNGSLVGEGKIDIAR